MIIAKPAHTIPSTRAEKLRGVPENEHTGKVSISTSRMIVLVADELVRDAFVVLCD